MIFRRGSLKTINGIKSSEISQFSPNVALQLTAPPEKWLKYVFFVIFILYICSWTKKNRYQCDLELWPKNHPVWWTPSFENYMKFENFQKMLYFTQKNIPNRETYPMKACTKHFLIPLPEISDFMGNFF